MPLPGTFNRQQRVEEEGETKTDWTLPLPTELIKVRTKRFSFLTCQMSFLESSLMNAIPKDMCGSLILGQGCS